MIAPEDDTPAAVYLTPKDDLVLLSRVRPHGMCSRPRARGHVAARPSCASIAKPCAPPRRKRGGGRTAPGHHTRGRARTRETLNVR